MPTVVGRIGGAGHFPPTSLLSRHIEGLEPRSTISFNTQTRYLDRSNIRSIKPTQLHDCSFDDLTLGHVTQPKREGRGPRRSRNGGDFDATAGTPGTIRGVEPPEARRGRSSRCVWLAVQRRDEVDNHRPKPAIDTEKLTSRLRLHDYKNQESYYAKIVERYMKFCAASGGGEELEKAFAALSVKAPSPLSLPPHHQQQQQHQQPTRPDLLRQISATDRPNDLPNILLAMRKLREGILGSRRHDPFAQRAYIFIIHASILTGSWEAYHPALLYLLHEIHPRVALSAPELQEFAGYLVLDLACRQDELMEAYGARSSFKQTDRRIATVVSCLVQEDWVRFWRTKRAVDGYQRAIMEFAAERVRLHALKCLGREYMSADKAFVERSGDASWADLVKGGVGWQLQENGVVVIRKPKAK